MNFYILRRRFSFAFVVTAWLLVSIWSAQGAFATEVVLSYEVSEHISEDLKPVSNATKKVVFGENFFSVVQDSKERVYDFNKRRVYYLDHELKTKSDIALYADIAFRVAELQDRIYVLDRMQQAGKKVPYDLYTLESLFGLEGTKALFTLGERKVSEIVVELLDQQDVLAELTITNDTPQVKANLFEKFLIYDHALHPRIRERILREKRIVRSFKYYLESPSSRDQFTTHLKHFELRPDQGYEIPQEYRMISVRPGALPGAEVLDKFMQDTRQGLYSHLKKSKEWFWEQAQVAHEKKDYLNAVVYYLEYGLQSGDQAQVLKKIQKIGQYQNKNELLDQFLRSLGVGGEAQAKRAIEVLEAFDRSYLDRPHIIDLMLASHKAVLGEDAKAVDFFSRALVANPYLAGVYKDLGDLFYRQRDMSSAWLCWDFARELEPNHFMMQAISDYEKELVESYPNFF